MNQFVTFIRKETMHILRDVYSLTIMLIMPVTLLLILGYAVSNDIKNTPFAVLDESKTPISEKFIAKLDGNKYFSFERNLTAFSQIDEAFRIGESQFVIIFPKNFEEDLFRTKHAEIQVIIDASDPNLATTIDNYLHLVTMQFLDEQARGGEISLNINSEVKMFYNPQIKSAYSFVPGLMGMLMMIICAMMTSISIVREKERGTMEILLISPLKPTSIVLAKAIPYFVVSMVDVVLILLIAHFVMGVPIVGSLLMVLFLSAVFTLAALSLGMLISSVAKEQQTAMVVSLVGLMVPSMLLSGVLFPVESMPVTLQYLSHIIPAKWYTSAIRSVMIQGVGWAEIWEEITILLSMTIFLLTVSIMKFKNRL